jgi:hypothetical protein
MKLSEKAIHFIYLGIGGLVFLVFLVLLYFDYDEMDIKQKEHDGVKNEISEAEKKKAAIGGLKNELWFLREKHEHFRSALPEEKNFMDFYKTLEDFRLERKMNPWTAFQIDKIVAEQNEGDKKGAKPGTPTPPPPPPKRGEAPEGPFRQTNYTASIPVTFNQLGQILNQIENYKQFYGVSQIQIPTMQLPKKDKEAKEAVGGDEMEGIVTLKLVSFSYSGANPLEQEVEKYIPKEAKDRKAKFTPTKDMEDKLAKKKKEWDEKSHFSWSKPGRDIFDQSHVLTPIRKDTPPPPNGKPEIHIVPPTLDKLKDILKDLETVRDHLHTLATGEKWVELDNQIREKRYEPKLNAVVVPSQQDEDGKIKARIEKWRTELKEWKKLIMEASREKKANDLVQVGEGKVATMKDLYTKGKEKGSESTLRQVLKTHDEIVPQFREFKDFEKKIKALENLRKEAEELYSKADTQIKIIHLASKLKLFGIIYIKDKPELSVVFIEKKAVKKNDVLMMGFVVHEIEEGKVILRYKEETVPIPLKKPSKAKATDSL